MHYIVATESVHTTAAACDYLLETLSSGDQVTVLTITSPDNKSRDAADAANVATARLTGACELAFEQQNGEPAAEIEKAADTLDTDVILMGVHSGQVGARSDLGNTAQSVLESVSIPTVILQPESLS
jgi:nucleotide-binding universal stress UspA family protein